ncbi:hypothetical protein A3709_20660 [Halioglobus sp. HI00S01]|uniref:hypothetical protein n=1 Tax=Halioglobus sp. HI00S01 TaxID=1822214 RepID=UPI0007C21B55|nr:hypothetical protein [Halioglobus sp. HI00S01]KZX58026.1 hypothetical protein A3709_20660 [Halioglobus sp. HI00S01]
MNQILCICGMTLAGKDHLRKALLGAGMFQDAVSTTTRPPRYGERHGIDYFFCSREDFAADMERGQFIEHNVIKGELYGLKYDAFTPAFVAGKTALMVADPNGMEAIREYSVERGVQFRSVFIDIAQEAQMKRMFERFRDDKNASCSVYAARTLHIFESEAAWRSEYSYDHTISHFGPDNQNEVVRELTELSAAQTIRSRAARLVSTEDLGAGSSRLPSNKVITP